MDAKVGAGRGGARTGGCSPVILLSTHWPLYFLPPGMNTVPLSPFLSAGSGPCCFATMMAGS